MEKLLDVVDGIQVVTSGTHEDSTEAIGIFLGAGLVTSLRLRPDLEHMELSVVILTLEENLVVETMKL